LRVNACKHRYLFYSPALQVIRIDLRPEIDSDDMDLSFVKAPNPIAPHRPSFITVGTLAGEYEEDRFLVTRLRIDYEVVSGKIHPS